VMQDDRAREWFETNRANWDERVPIHVTGRFYDQPGFLAGRDTLQPFERDEVGDVAGKTLVHLQCHFGQDTLSWARSGARVTGLDFSAPAIEAARAAAAQIGVDADFVVSNVYDAAEALGERQFDIVYVGIGSLIWLPDVAAWAKVVARLLRPGGFLYLSDGHPMAQILADESLTVEHSYFATEPTRWEEPGTYADLDAVTTHNVTYEWPHALSEVFSAILAAGLRIDCFAERDYALYPRWPFLDRRDDGTWRMPADMPSVPLMYSLRASKPA
jgi:2-polyprenyl-3-methyl-5-hydroxy-6-metoxy-1,4-benzoquinol methylase